MSELEFDMKQEIDNETLGDLLRFDSLDAAEQITGKSYKECEGTSALGMILQLHSSRLTANILNSRGDTTMSMEWEEYQDALRRFGFRKIHEREINRPKWNHKDEWQLWFHDDGILLACDSDNWNDASLPVGRNSATMYYNWKPSKEYLTNYRHGVTSSGYYWKPDEVEW